MPQTQWSFSLYSTGQSALDCNKDRISPPVVANIRCKNSLLCTALIVINLFIGTHWLNDEMSIQCTWRRHQMETFCALLDLCTGEFPAQKPVKLRFAAFFDLRPINDWTNNREAGDLGCHRAHYDVIEMSQLTLHNCFCELKVWAMSY